MTIEDGNKLIADFIGLEKKESYGGIRYFYNNAYSTDLRFHVSWDWLMPVVEKIASKGYRWEIGMGTSTNSPTHYCKIWSIGKFDGISPLDATYGSIIEFIKWYNTK